MTRPKACLRAFDAFQPVVEQDFAAFRARDFGRPAAGVPGEKSAFETLRAALRDAADRNHELAARSDRMSWIGTVVVMVLLVVGLTALLALLDVADRRRLRDGRPAPARLPRLADRPAQPLALRAPDRRDPEAAARPPSSPSSTWTTSSASTTRSAMRPATACLEIAGDRLRARAA